MFECLILPCCTLTDTSWSDSDQLNQNPWAWSWIRTPGERLPTPVFWPEVFHGLCSPWGCKESDTTEQLSPFFHFQGPLEASLSAHHRLHVQGFWFSRSGWSLSICISHEFPGAAAAGWDHILRTAARIQLMFCGYWEVSVRVLQGEENQTFKHTHTHTHIYICIDPEQCPTWRIIL